MKLQLLEVDLEQQIQHQGAQDLLSREALPSGVAADLWPHQVVQNMGFELRQAVENLGDGGELFGVLV